MRIEAMRTFLSEDAIREHLEHYRLERCKYAILEKSIPGIRGKSLRELYELPLNKELKKEILPKVIFLKSHELYFSSFCERRLTCNEIRKYYSSEAAFLYEVEEKACRMRCGFLYIARDRSGKPVAIREEECAFGRDFAPCLAIDMAEHAYFLDYRFEREKYIRGALAGLALNEIFSNENSRIYLDTPI